MAELPIACALTAAELEARGAGLLPGLVQRASARIPVASGYRWVFSSVDGLLEDVACVIAAERRCCRFLRFIVAAEPDGGAISLEVTGPSGTAQFLDHLVAGQGS